MLRLFTQTQPSTEVDIYSAYLPAKLYSYLQKQGFLDGNDHAFQHEEGDKKDFTISVKAEKIQFGAGSTPDSVVIRIANNSKGSENHYAFAKKSWFCSMFISPEGLPSTCGNIKMCPLNGLTDRECLNKTSDQVNKLISTLNNIIAPGEKSELDIDENIRVCVLY
jgi:hypothetical protein